MLSAQNHYHLKTFAFCLQAVKKDHFGVFSRSEYFWNLPEMDVCGDFGEKFNVFGSSATKSMVQK